MVKYTTIAGAAAVALLASPALAGKPSWGHYKRADGDTPATPRYSPLPPINGETITKSVQQQIATDVKSVIDEFSTLPDYVQNTLKTALTKIVNQNVAGKTPEEQTAIIQKAVADSFTKIEATIPTTLAQISAMDDTGKFQVLQDCVAAVIAKGGRQSESEETCLSQSGFSAKSIKEQFATFVDINTFQAPAKKINDAYDEVIKYLDSVTLVPATEDLIKNAAEAMRNVVLTESALERDATNKVLDCWLDTIAAISDVPLANRQQTCVTGNGEVKGSALQDLETAFISRVNQYAGALPPTLVGDIQRRGVTTLTLNLGSYDSAVRDAINTAILSAAAATSGESASVVQDLIQCINTMYDDTPDEQCNPNSSPEVLEHNANVVRNYLAQYVSTLPKILVEALGSTIYKDLASDEGVEAATLRKELDDLFQKASLGSLYENCARETIDCVIAFTTQGTSTTQCYEDQGDQCKTLPALSPSSGTGGNPYAGIIDGLNGDGSWGGARKRAMQKMARRANKKFYKPVV